MPLRCKRCRNAVWTLRQLGFADTVTWSALDGTCTTEHATHSNARGVLCSSYASELLWQMAGRPDRTLVYLAHPLSVGHFDINVDSAARWVRFLRSMNPIELERWSRGLVIVDVRPVVMAPWLGGVASDVEHPLGREGAIADCTAVASLFDEVWAVGSVTDGVAAEMAIARRSLDLTHLDIPDSFVG